LRKKGEKKKKTTAKKPRTGGRGRTRGLWQIENAFEHYRNNPAQKGRGEVKRNPFIRFSWCQGPLIVQDGGKKKGVI